MSLKVFTDQMGRQVLINFPPKRIISLVPSQTELLFTLGLEEQVVGITKFCIHPVSWFRNKVRVGGTKNLNVEKIRQLSPDLIIANKEENEQKQIEELIKEFPVWISDITTYSEALSMIKEVGDLTGRVESASYLAEKIENSQPVLEPLNRSVLYLIWQNPFIAVGENNYINDRLSFLGLQNVCMHTNSRYPEVSPQQIEQLNPDFIFLSSEPFPFKEKHVRELQQLFPKSILRLVDGEMFSWYGSRMLEANTYFGELYATLRD